MKSTTDIQMSKMPGNSFNDIYTSYYKKSFFFAKSYVHNDLAAEDIASEALIKLREKLKAEPVEEKYILPLLLTILKNKALDYLKHEEVKRSAFEVMATGNNRNCLSVCLPWKRAILMRFFRKKWKKSSVLL